MLLSLLVMAASLNAMAITYTGKATVTLTSSDNKSCTMTIAESDELSDGLNNGYYAELNTEGREVALYVVYNGKYYQQFAAKSLADMDLGVLTNASTDYTLTVSNVSGSKTLTIRINGEDIALTNGLTKNITLTANQALGAVAGMVEPATPATPAICHQNGRLEITAYQGASVKVLAYADESEVIAATAITAAYQEIELKDLAAGQYIVVLTTTDGDQRLVIKK